jgi:hypothetical protein
MMSRRLRIGSIMTVFAWGLIAAACGAEETSGNDAGSGGRAGSAGGRAGSAGGSAGSAGGGAGSSAVGNTGGAGVGVGGASAPGAGRGGTAGSGSTAQVCPSAEPANGEACQSGRGDCMFGTKICDCPNDTSVWICWDPATDCPATQPAEQSACSVVGIDCEYAQPQGGGQGGGNDCECTDTGWDCGGQFCPPAEPAAATTCEGGDGVCTYDARVCDCDQSIWACWNKSDCPATTPVEASACTLQGMICEYAGGECECDDAAWECDINDADGGV